MSCIIIRIIVAYMYKSVYNNTDIKEGALPQNIINILGVI